MGTTVFLTSRGNISQQSYFMKSSGKRETTGWKSEEGQVQEHELVSECDAATEK
jgi:hypothetical protein